MKSDYINRFKEILNMTSFSAFGKSKEKYLFGKVRTKSFTNLSLNILWEDENAGRHSSN